MGYYDKERVRGFLHNQDGIIVNDFGEEVILRGWGMGNWDNPEGFMLGTQSGFGLFEPGKYAPMGRMDRGRSMDQILRETCGTKYAEEFWKRWRRLYLTEEDIDFSPDAVTIPCVCRSAQEAFCMRSRGLRIMKIPLPCWMMFSTGVRRIRFMLS